MLKERGLLIGAVVVVVGGFGYLIATSQNGNQGNQTADIEGVMTYEGLGRNHVQQAVEYPQTPPVGGDHSPVWVACNGKVYDQPVPAGEATHAMEHGALWITYKPDLTAEQQATLREKATAPYTFMSPVPAQTSPVVLTSWGSQLAVATADDERVDAFISQYRQGPNTPERGATCSSPAG